MTEIADYRVSSYHRLQTELGNIIANTPPGEKLPSEPKLSQQLGISRATLREAMRSFEGQGIIRRKQGIGTFVISHTHIIESGLEVLESIETISKRIELPVSMGALTINYSTADEEQALAFGVPAKTPLVKVERVILVEDRPVAFLIDLVVNDILLPSELQKGFTGSVLDFLLRRGTPRLANSVAELQAVAASSDIARLLEIQRGDALLFLSGKLYTEEGRMIDLSSSYFLPGYFRFQVVRRVGNL